MYKVIEQVRQFGELVTYCVFSGTYGRCEAWMNRHNGVMFIMAVL
jgi:hypothetical protein